MKTLYLPTFRDEDNNTLVLMNDTLTFDNQAGCERFMKDNEVREISRILKLTVNGFTTVEPGESLDGVKVDIGLKMLDIHAICIAGPIFDKHMAKSGKVELVEVETRPEVGSWVEVWIEPNGTAGSICLKRDSDGKCHTVGIGPRRELNLDEWINDKAIKARKIFVSSKPPEHKDGVCVCNKAERIQKAAFAIFGKEISEMLNNM